MLQGSYRTYDEDHPSLAGVLENVQDTPGGATAFTVTISGHSYPVRWETDTFVFEHLQPNAAALQQHLGTVIEAWLGPADPDGVQRINGINVPSNALLVWLVALGLGLGITAVGSLRR